MMGIKNLQNNTRGFTIVEMIIVVIVIGIIVAITVVSYSSITTSSNQQTLQTELKGVASKLTRYKADNGGYPALLSDINVSNTSTITYTYTYGSVSDGYCLVSAGYSMSFYITNIDSTPKSGTTCPVMPS